MSFSPDNGHSTYLPRDSTRIIGIKIFQNSPSDFQYLSFIINRLHRQTYILYMTQILQSVKVTCK